MPQTMQVNVFDQEHFPVGTAVRVRMGGRFFDAVILRYEQYFTQMVITTAGVAWKAIRVGPSAEGNQVKLNVHELDDEYTLERLVPESEEEKDLNYETLMNEHGGAYDRGFAVIDPQHVTIRVRVYSDARKPQYEAVTDTGDILHDYPLPTAEITFVNLDKMYARDEFHVEYPIVVTQFDS